MLVERGLSEGEVMGAKTEWLRNGGTQHTWLDHGLEWGWRACDAGAACDLPCETGVIDCSTGSPVCQPAMARPDGDACVGEPGVCVGGLCGDVITCRYAFGGGFANPCIDYPLGEGWDYAEATANCGAQFSASEWAYSVQDSCRDDADRTKRCDIPMGEVMPPTPHDYYVYEEVFPDSICTGTLGGAVSPIASWSAYPPYP